MATYILEDDGRLITISYQGLESQLIRVDHGEDSTATFEKIHKISYVADALPPLNGLLAFRKYSSLFDILTTAKHDPGYISSDHTSVTDRFRALVKELSWVIIEASKEKIRLDVQNELKNVYVTDQDDIHRIKVIALRGGDEVSEDECLSNIRIAFNAIESICQLQDKRFLNLKQKLDRSAVKRDVVAVLSSHHFFWTKYVRVNVILRLGEYMELKGNKFYYLSRRSTNLVNWRATMAGDTIIHQLLNITKQDNKLKAGHVEYNILEVDCLLKFVRKCFAHFITIAQRYFMNEDMLLDHFELKFPDIMNDIYHGIETTHKIGDFNFLD